MSKMLVTEVSPSGPEGEPVLAANAAITTLPAAPVATAATVMTQWALEDQKNILHQEA